MKDRAERALPTSDTSDVVDFTFGEFATAVALCLSYAIDEKQTWHRLRNEAKLIDFNPKSSFKVNPRWKRGRLIPFNRAFLIDLTPREQRAWAIGVLAQPPSNLIKGDQRTLDRLRAKLPSNFDPAEVFWQFVTLGNMPPSVANVQMEARHFRSPNALKRARVLVAQTKMASSSAASANGLGSVYRIASVPRIVVPRSPFETDPDAIDRGNAGHVSTQNALAKSLRLVGVEPRSPREGEPDYDIAWVRSDMVFVAEVKSITSANEEKQLRLGLGQVLRYRHQLAGPRRTVVAVLVPEREPTDLGWKALCRALGVRLAWPNEFSDALATT